MSSSLLSKTIEDKRYLWLERTNQYVVLEQEAFAVAEKLIKGEIPETIATHLETTLSVPFEAALKFVKELEDQILNSSTKGQEKSINYLSKTIIPSDFEITTTYQVNNTLIKVSYKSDVEASYIHPKFAHLETDKLNKVTDFKVFITHDKIYLAINNKVKYGWPKEEIHYFQGKFSMEFIQAMYDREESEWMGVFHASAVSNLQKAVLFLGDSGNGKSTSLALLQAQGFQCIADDFVPIDVSKKIHTFPAGISIKKNSLPVLLDYYPELKNSAEYHYSRLNKTVRYLPPKNINYQEKNLCKALVFIKYDSNTDFEISKISSLEAFEKLVPDSWISPIPKNATTFLEWFEKLPCYQLTYSNNKKMYAAVKDIFEKEA